jgi:hypothetical protein
MKGEALTTAASAKLEFAFQVLDVHDEDVHLLARQGEQELLAVQASDLRSPLLRDSPREYQCTAAARRISRANSSGVLRRAAKTSSGI